MAMVVCTSLYCQKKYGVVKYSVNFMRTYPDYESGLETQALMGTPVEILGRQGYWLQIRTPEPYVAWATDMGVVPMDSLQLQNYLAAPKYVCTSLWTEVYDSPESGAQRISDLVAGDIVRIKYDSRNRPLKHKLYLGIVLPDGRDAFVKYPDVVRFSDWAASAGRLRPMWWLPPSVFSVRLISGAALRPRVWTAVVLQGLHSS